MNSQRRHTIRTKVFLGFSILGVFAVCLAAGTFWALKTMSDLAFELTSFRDEQQAVFLLHTGIQELRQHIELYQTVSYESYHAVIDTDITSVRAALANLTRGTTDPEVTGALGRTTTGFNDLAKEVEVLTMLSETAEDPLMVDQQARIVRQSMDNAHATVITLTTVADAAFDQKITSATEYIAWVTTILTFVMLLLLVFAVLAAVILSRMLTRPIEILARAALALMGGDYTARAEVRSNDEFGQLAHVFNEMAGRLQDNARVLEGQVATRTKELGQTIAQLDQSAKMLIRRDLELSRANEELLSVDKMKSEFVSVVTHQLRTPLSAVKWVLSMLLQGEFGQFTPEQRTFIMKAQESNDRMITLVNDLASADRIDSGRFKPEFIPTDVYSLAQNLILEMQPVATSRNLALAIQSDLKSNTRAVIAPDNLRAVLQNLIENSIRYTAPGGTITVSFSEDQDMVVIAVADTGIGIPAAEQKQVFKRFYRAPNAVKMETDGSGLGLYLVRNIVEGYSGMVSFVSKEGVGTTFTVKIPRERSAS